MEAVRLATEPQQKQQEPTTATKTQDAVKEGRLLTEIQNDTITTADGTTHDDGLSLDFGMDDGLVEEREKPADGDGTEPAEAEAEETAAVEEEAVALADLGEWKQDDPEIVAKFEARYFTPEGQLNQQALGAEFWEAYAKDPAKAELKPATYAFLKDTLGITKEFAQEIEKALVSQAKTNAFEFYGKFGGQERFQAAVKWGKGGGYTPAQKARFNAAMRAGGEEWSEAVEALMARYNRINPLPSGGDGKRRGPPQGGRRQSSPARQATGGGAEAPSGDAGKGFPSILAYREAWRDALAKKKAAKTPEEKRAAKQHINDVWQRAHRHRFEP
jgi:hypothetical protein